MPSAINTEGIYKSVTRVSADEATGVGNTLPGAGVAVASKTVLDVDVAMAESKGRAEYAKLLNHISASE